MKNKLKILITGPVAPPAGGISIHIQRLSHLLQDDFEIDLIDESHKKKNGIFNIRSLNVFTYIKKLVETNLLFVQSGNRFFKKLHIVMGSILGKRLIITVHGYGKRRPQPFRAIDSYCFNLAHQIVLVNADIFNKLPLRREKCIVKHAFLPPLMENEPPLPHVINEWIHKARAAHTVIICANASKLTTHNDEDLYGLDTSIELTKRLIEKGMPIHFIYTVSALDRGSDMFSKYLEQVRQLGLEDRFMLISEKLSFVRLIEKADIVIRPTNTDGDALTIREALFLNKPTIASDVVERPAGTILFRTRDINDLEDKVAAQVRKANTQHLHPLDEQDVPLGDFKNFYSELINSVAFR